VRLARASKSSVNKKQSIDSYSSRKERKSALLAQADCFVPFARSERRHARAIFQSRVTLCGEIFSTTAVSSTLISPKKRSSILASVCRAPWSDRRWPRDVLAIASESGRIPASGETGAGH